VESDVARELRKVANLIALRQLEGLKKGEQARVLYAAGFSYADIASLTGMSEGSARSHVSQGRKRTDEAEE
jgi:DNA-directed RNA polymerase specialized sigma24 family protein